MDEKKFGLKLRRLREEIGMTREQFCDDEVELTVRQLTRIESGNSKPTLTKITFIANRLGMSLYELMPDYVRLPERYTKLKYDILRNPTYKNPALIEERDRKLAEIYDEFYEDLPEEERLAIDTLQSSIDILETGEAHFGKEIIDDYSYQIHLKDRYSINDLLLIRLYIQHIQFGEVEVDSEEFQCFLDFLEVLLHQVQVLEPDNLFLLRDLLMISIGILGKKDLYQHFPDLLEALEQIMRITQDFQKKPILSMLKWKYELFANGNEEQAKYYYEEAIMFARLISDQYLADRLEKDWQLDCAEA